MKNRNIFVCIFIISLFVACKDNGDFTSPEITMANAGINQTLTLENNLIVILDGSQSGGDIVSYFWECVEFTADQGTILNPYTLQDVNVLILNSDKVKASVKVRKAGTYIFKLSVTGRDSIIDTNETVVIVKSYLAEKNITVAFPEYLNQIPGFYLSSEILDLTPIYHAHGQWGEFNSNDVVYTVEDNFSNEWNSASGFEIDAKLYSDNARPIFTQIFNYNGTILCSQIFESLVLDMTGFNDLIFCEVYESGNAFAQYEDGIPDMNFTLNRIVSEYD